MPEQRSLTVNVNARFTVDAGSWQERVEEEQRPYRLVSPPQTTMYRQVLSYLEQTSHGSASWSEPPCDSCLSPSRSSTGRRITTASGRLAPSIQLMEDAI